MNDIGNVILFAVLAGSLSAALVLTALLFAVAKSRKDWEEQERKKAEENHSSH